MSDSAALLSPLASFGLAGRPEVRHVRVLDATPGQPDSWPDWLAPNLIGGLQAAGIQAPWRHQVQAAELVFAGRHTAISTATASGKTLAYLMPVLAATAVEPGRARLGRLPTDLRTRLGLARHSALYLAPTKALAHDQRRAAVQLGPPGWRMSALDADSTPAQRRFASTQADFVLSNPDMLHRSVLPNHTKWAGLLGSLRYVIVDEAHRYRGVFGAQVSAVLRRLRRLCNRYGSDPVFVLASATSADAEVCGAALIGEDEPLELVERDFSPHGRRTFVLWRPSDTMTHDVASLMASLVDNHNQVLTFVPSRTQAELVALRAQDAVQGTGRIASYRAGYLPSDRRSIESQLCSGALSGVAATNALELGVDICGLDAVLIAGYPGSLNAFWQQAGRAGRALQDALVVLLARADPLDAYLVEHPELLFDAPAEASVLNPSNPLILGPQLAAAAQEAPLTPADERWFGPTMTQLCDHLVSAGLLRKRASGWFWTLPDRAVDKIDLRGGAGRPIDVIESGSGRVVGTVERAAGDRTVHQGAIYLHQGDQWLVTDYLLDDAQALVRPVAPANRGYYTQPKSVSDLRICSVAAQRTLGRTLVCYGEVELTSQVVGYLRRDELSGEVWDETPLDLPARTHHTQAVWWVVSRELCDELGLPDARVAAAAHAVEHTAIGLLPLFSVCDRWDVGGLSTLLHPDTGTVTIFVHDATPGGAGFAERGWQVADQWLTATLQRLTECPCQTGCPACIVSPKCGNANQLLDKQAAKALLAKLLDLN